MRWCRCLNYRIFAPGFYIEDIIMWVAVLKETGEVIARNQYAILCSLAASNITNGDKSLYVITKEEVIWR